MARYYPIRSVILLFLVLALACKRDEPENKNPTLDERYAAAITDAISADSTEIIDTLWAISKTNSGVEFRTFGEVEYVLMATFHNYPKGYLTDTIYSRSTTYTFVFIPKQFSQYFRATIPADGDLQMRALQLIGLPPNDNKTHFAELWVRPQDLIRPSGDYEIDDRTAQPYLTGTASKDSYYSNWYAGNTYWSYFSGSKLYPWTRIGYTFDWAGLESEVGISEYLIKPSSMMLLKEQYTAIDYLSVISGK
jgi:hypothetical protein